MSVTVRLVGLESLNSKLGADLKPAIRGASLAIAAEIQGEIAPYPPSSAANSPGGPGSRWYERGYGTKRMTQDGAVVGRKTSQMLGRSWAIERRGDVGAVLGARATYAPFVHGHEQQAKYHGMRGWKTDKQAVEKVIRSGVIQDILGDAVIAKIDRSG